MITMDSLVEILSLLRHLGKNALPYLNKAFNRNEKQYLAAALLTEDELSNRHYEFIVEPRNEIAKWTNSGKEPQNVKCCASSMSFGRLTVLLNLSEPNIHGESRLLDPKGEIRSSLKDKVNKKNLQRDKCRLDVINVFELIQQAFYKKFCENRPYWICMFSHLVPCTIANHQCASLIRLFAERFRIHIVVSYQNVYCDTDLDTALVALYKSKYVHCVDPHYLGLKNLVTCFSDCFLRPWDKHGTYRHLSQRIQRREKRKVGNKSRNRDEGKKRKNFQRDDKSLEYWFLDNCSITH